MILLPPLPLPSVPHCLLSHLPFLLSSSFHPPLPHRHPFLILLVCPLLSTYFDLISTLHPSLISIFITFISPSSSLPFLHLLLTSVLFPFYLTCTLPSSFYIYFISNSLHPSLMPIFISTVILLISVPLTLPPFPARPSFSFHFLYPSFYPCIPVIFSIFPSSLLHVYSSLLPLLSPIFSSTPSPLLFLLSTLVSVLSLQSSPLLPSPLFTPLLFHCFPIIFSPLLLSHPLLFYSCSFTLFLCPCYLPFLSSLLFPSSSISFPCLLLSTPPPPSSSFPPPSQICPLSRPSTF